MTASQSIGDQCQQALVDAMYPDQVIDALRAELASYRALPLVPQADFDRLRSERNDAVLARERMAIQLDNAQRAQDLLAATLAMERDARATVTTRRALDLLAEGARLQSTTAGGPAEHDYARRRAAFLAEQGVVPPETEEMRAHTLAWMEGRR